MEYEDIDGRPSDLVLVVGDKCHKCHKDVLKSSSGYFKSMFSGNFAESEAKEVRVRDISNENLTHLLTYAYKNQIDIPTSVNDTRQLMLAANFYQFDTLIKVLVSHLINHMTVETCLENLITLEHVAVNHLRDCAKMYALWDLFWQPRDLLDVKMSLNNLPFDVIYEILSDIRLRVRNECWILLAAALWTQSNDTTEQQFNSLVRCIDISLLNVSHLDIVKFQIHNAKRLPLLEIVEKLVYEFNSGIRRSNLKRLLPMKPIIFTLDQTAGNESIVFNYMLNMTDFRFEKFGNFPLKTINVKNITGVSICGVGKDLYIFGGRENYGSGNWNTSLWKYNSFKKSFEQLRSLPRKLRHVKFTADETSIYVAGGYGAYRVITNSLFNYNISKDVWSELPELPFPGSNSFTITLFNGILYFFSDGYGIYQLNFLLAPFWQKLDTRSQLPIKGITQSWVTDTEILIFSPLEDKCLAFHPDKGVTRNITMQSELLWEYCVVFNGNIFIYTTQGQFRVFDVHSKPLSNIPNNNLNLITDFTSPCVLPIY